MIDVGDDIRRNDSGFTLIELMAAITIMFAIYLMVGPSINRFMASHTMSTSINEFTAFYHYAKSEAVKRNSTVTICASTTGAACAGAWQTGWIVFNDLDGDGVVDGNEAILKRRTALDPAITLTGNAPVASHITLTARGYAIGHAGTLTMCDGRGASVANARVISFNGRIRRAVDSNGDSIVEGGGGANVACP